MFTSVNTVVDSIALGPADGASFCQLPELLAPDIHTVLMLPPRRLFCSSTSFRSSCRLYYTSSFSLHTCHTHFATMTSRTLCYCELALDAGAYPSICHSRCYCKHRGDQPLIGQYGRCLRVSIRCLRTSLALMLTRLEDSVFSPLK